jgi:hypothetical protein
VACAGDAGLYRIPIAAAAVRVQDTSQGITFIHSQSGGAVYVSKGELLFDGVAISGMRASVRPLGLAHVGCVAGSGARRAGGVGS